MVSLELSILYFTAGLAVINLIAIISIWRILSAFIRYPPTRFLYEADVAFSRIQALTDFFEDIKDSFGRIKSDAEEARWGECSEAKNIRKILRILEDD